MLSKVLGKSCRIFCVFGMTPPGIEPRSPGPLANILLIRPTAWKKTEKKKKNLKKKENILLKIRKWMGGAEFKKEKYWIREERKKKESQEKAKTVHH